MDEYEWNMLLIGIIIGGGVLAFVIGCINNFENIDVDIGLSQESANLICQKITNNTNAIAIDWNPSMDKPKDSLVCNIAKIREYNGLIQIQDN